jgi:hypothetical protein
MQSEMTSMSHKDNEENKSVQSTEQHPVTEVPELVIEQKQSLMSLIMPQSMDEIMKDFQPQISV